jgi:catechol 2,3-dioxygenase-like lactoylglutathione lyase family enzyme
MGATVTLGHINIVTDRLEETVGFYQALFGFERGPSATRPGSNAGVWLFDANGVPCIHLNALEDGQPQRPGSGGCLDHVAFNCPDQAAMTDRLAAARIPYDMVAFPVAGLVQFNLVDPNGVRIELTFGHEAVRRPPREAS